MPQSDLSPNVEEIERHLRHITRRWHELGQDLRLEINYLTNDKPALMRGSPQYRVDQLRQAAEDVAGHNIHHLNCYAVVNPLDARRPIEKDKRAMKHNIAAAFFHFAEADNEQGAENIRNFVGPKCTFHVVTGTIPTTRPHVYWELEEPTLNLTAWEETQRAIARTLGTDRSVVDPCRMMRIAGTINWPKPNKVQSEGRVPELTRMRIYDPDERPLISSERMFRAFGGASAPQSAAEGRIHIETGQHTGKSSEDFRDILRRARTDGEKHTGVRDLAASLAGQGVSRALAEALIAEACPVWDRNVEALIDSAYAKFARAPAHTPNFDHAPAPTASDPQPAAQTWQVQRASDFTADFIAPEYIVDGVIQRGRVYTFTAPTGSGKTAAMLYASTCIATGTPFCEREVQPGDVLFMAGENPDDVRARVIATMEYHRIDPATCNLHFIAGTFSIRADLERLRAEAEKLPNLVLVVVDTFAAYFDGDDENSNAQALDFTRIIRKIAAFDSKPAVIMPAHPVKNATRGNLSPKGGSSLLNEVDGNLTLWNEGGMISMHWQGKFRGPEFEPLRMELERYETDRLRDNKGRLMPTILAKPLFETRAMQIAAENLTREDRVLMSIETDPALSIRERCVTVGLTGKTGKALTTTMTRTLEKLSDQKLIRKFRTNWELTKEGERAVEMIRSGARFARET